MINLPEITPDKFKSDVYKYVRFEDGLIRFCKIRTHHKELCDESDTSSPISAGVILVRNKTWKIYDKGSDTLNLPGLNEDKEIVEEFLTQYGFQYMS